MADKGTFRIIPKVYIEVDSTTEGVKRRIGGTQTKNLLMRFGDFCTTMKIVPIDKPHEEPGYYAAHYSPDHAVMIQGWLQREGLMFKSS